VARRRSPLSGPVDDRRAQRIAVWVEQSCREQGLLVKIADRGVLAEIAELLRPPPDERQSRQSGRRRDSSKRL
jgi:hypothetical protein